MDSYAQFIYLCYARFAMMRRSARFISRARIVSFFLFLFMCERACERANATLLRGAFDSGCS